MVVIPGTLAPQSGRRSIEGLRAEDVLRSQLSDRVLFFRSFLAHPRRVGAVLPTSRRAVNDMLDMADLSSARLVVELGAGTGSHTGEVLRRLAPDARFLSFEIDPQLVAALQRRITDPRLQVVNDSAENLASYLDGERPDVVVSELPFTSLPQNLGGVILDRVVDLISPSGTLLVLQYSPFVLPQLRRRFASVRHRFSPLNVPPAMLFACREPRTSARPPS